MNELEVLLKEKAVTLEDGRKLVIKPLSWKASTLVLLETGKIIEALLENGGVDQIVNSVNGLISKGEVGINLGDLMGVFIDISTSLNEQVILSLNTIISLGSGLEVEDIEQLPFDEGFELLKAVISLNWGFIQKKCLKPQAPKAKTVKKQVQAPTK